MPRRGTAKRKRIVERRRTTVTAVDFKYANGQTMNDSVVAVIVGGAVDEYEDDKSEAEESDNDDGFPSQLADIVFGFCNDMDSVDVPSKKDWASALMIFKARCGITNTTMNFVCKMLRLKNISPYYQNVPHSWDAIKYTLSDRNLNCVYQTYYYCNLCETVDKMKCSCGKNDTTIFYYSSIQRQIQQILLMRNTYTKICAARNDIDNNYSHTHYAKILKSCPDSCATLLLNSDGVELLKGVGIWPFMLVLNELPIKARFMLKNIVLPLIWPTGKLPTTKQIQASARILVAELVELEVGCDYYIPELGRTTKLYLYTIASCNDKPSQCKMENVKSYMAEYGCGVCYTRGDLFHFNKLTQYSLFKIRQKVLKRQPPLRVYPYEQTPTLRTNQTHDEILAKMRKENLTDEKGHLGKVEL
ncbi:unnamed protein product [Didymodactylos carnosus]|uniref:Uncharacterized protein n=1 Tax=Didymodactylos carnosus TaxID=1234261 RepID=A0A815EH24_9BILA|nr:unnamed protein product [Didymodactylos carnosus]CAF4149895.1 unnamed protein product [Didymodactylos carnosus]